MSQAPPRPSMPVANSNSAVNSAAINESVDRTFRETMEIISALKEEVDLMGENIKFSENRLQKKINESSEATMRKVTM